MDESTGEDVAVADNPKDELDVAILPQDGPEPEWTVEESEAFENLKSRKMLQQFLDDNVAAISILESGRQLISKMGDNVPSDLLDELGSEIKKKSSGKLSLMQGGLCEIGKDYWLGDHKRTDEERAKYPPFSQESAVRGFEFRYTSFNIAYRCIVLGQGGERAFYDGLTDHEKQKFFLPHVVDQERLVRKTMTDEISPFRHTALLEYNQNEKKYNILEFYSHTEEMPIGESSNEVT